MSVELDTALVGLLFSLLVLLASVAAIRQERLARLRDQLRIIDHGRGTSSDSPSARRPVGPAWIQRARSRKHGSYSVDLAGACVEMVGRLRAGDPVAKAWDSTWSRLTGEVSTDITPDGVPVDLERMDTPASRMVVVATRFSTQVGAPLSEVLLACAKSLNQLEEGMAAQRVAFAGPRLSARVLTALPIVGLCGGELVGLRSLTWLVSSPFGWTVAVVGLGLAAAGHVVSQRMIDQAARGVQEELQAPVLCELAVAGLRGGGPVPAVLRSLGVALEDPDFSRVGKELLLGARWGEAWDPMPVRGMLLAQGLQPAWEDGVAPVPLLLQLAADSRQRTVSAAKEAAERLSVKLAVPLGLFLLPSFVLLGLVPVLFTLVGTQGIFGPV